MTQRTAGVIEASKASRDLLIKLWSYTKSFLRAARSAATKKRTLPTDGVSKQRLQILDGHAENIERYFVVLQNVKRGRYSKPKMGKGITEKPDRTPCVVVCLPPPPERVPWPRRRGDVIEELVLVVDTRESTIQIVLQRELDSIDAVRIFAHHASEQRNPSDTHHRPGLQFRA